MPGMVQILLYKFYKLCQLLNTTQKINYYFVDATLIIFIVKYNKAV